MAFFLKQKLFRFRAAVVWKSNFNAEDVSRNESCKFVQFIFRTCLENKNLATLTSGDSVLTKQTPSFKIFRQLIFANQEESSCQYCCNSNFLSIV